MNRFYRNLNSEFLKLLYSKVIRIVIVLVTFVQGVLAYIASKQILSVGLNATPETNMNLYEAIPPIEYLGFDVIVFGLLPMIVLGAIYGSNEYKNHSLRTSLLFAGSKKSLFFSKLKICLSFSLVLSFVAIYISIIITHFALGAEGLHPFSLNAMVWKHILLASLSWTFLTLLSFLLGSLFRTAVVPLLFLIPQVYNVGNFLANYFTPARFLPVYLGNGLIATSQESISHNPIGNVCLLLLWIMIVGGVSYIRFNFSDVGGKY